VLVVGSRRGHDRGENYSIRLAVTYPSYISLRIEVWHIGSSERSVPGGGGGAPPWPMGVNGAAACWSARLGGGRSIACSLD
jgi:hypothetical protein